MIRQYTFWSNTVIWEDSWFYFQIWHWYDLRQIIWPILSWWELQYLVQGLWRLTEQHSKKLFVILVQKMFKNVDLSHCRKCYFEYQFNCNSHTQNLSLSALFSSRSVSQAQSPLPPSAKSRSLHHSVLCSFYLTSGHVMGILLDQSVSCACQGVIR